MLTLGQASCLVLGYKPNDPEERKKAKEHLEKSGLIAVHIRNHDPFQPMAIGINVHERDPFKFISYPDSPTMPPTDLPDNIDDHDGNDNNGNNDDSNNSGSDDSNNSGSDDSNNSGSDDSNSSIYKNNNSNNGSKDRSKKRKLDDTVIPFCKDRLLNLMKEIATDENPLNDKCYSKQFLTAKDQYQLMCSVFPHLKNHCSVYQLQYWIGQAKIWGKSTRSRKNQRELGRNLWVVDEQLRAFVTDTSDSVKAYWKYLQHDTKYITIGYARKSPTDETKESRIRLLQLMVNKLYFRGKCEEVFVSPICKADQPILERDSPKQDDLLLHLKGSHGDISDLVARVHFSQKPFRLVIIDYAGLSTSPNDIRIFLKQCSNIKEIVVDHGSSFEILSRFDLLKNMDLEKFKCRHANVKRSK
ncbi:uncharacterized protein B0P05DRAFT_565257 [Gilbertella persicaria]|uniref:uncharacterized protein n=1 Tax=Gilbertella persicaria TaxID=101096 RepID=UPI00221EF5C3|nr:uncharacterized protein B0P05DRAFT_565257 [Gilbertella persicaria]KAI8047843.1 hypothetical protein B0P05DRAFT_565257 [Gilbertella persicaria]